MFSSLPSASKVTYIHLYECGDAGHLKFPQDGQLKNSAVTAIGNKCTGHRTYALEICLKAMKNVKNYTFQQRFTLCLSLYSVYD